MKATNLKIAVSARRPFITGLIETMLDIIGVDQASTPTETVACVISENDSVRGDTRLSGPAAIDINKFVDVGLAEQALRGVKKERGEFLSEPWLSAKAMELSDAIKQAFFHVGLPFVTKELWPKGAAGCLVLTHDVDWLSFSPLHKVVAQGKSGAKVLRLGLSYAGGRRYGYNVSSIIQMEAEFGAKSTFLFRTSYTDAQERLVEAIKECKEAGCEIALHAAKGSHKSPEVMSREKSDLELSAGEKILGLRVHGLKFRQDITCSAWSRLGSNTT